MLELVELAEAVQPVADLQADGVLPADAGFQPAEVRMAEGQLAAHVSQPVAVRAVGIADQVAVRLSVR